jgi:competence protein ComEC
LPTSTSATVYFLDVGQGSSQVIDFQDGTLVIIDCGKSADALIMLLRRLKFQRIEAVVLSHWHEDHVGGAPALVKTYGSKIGFFYLPQDRPAGDILSNKVFRFIESNKKECRYEMERLEYHHIQHGRIHGANSTEQGPLLSILYPDYNSSLAAQMGADRNQGSGILMLQNKRNKILFPGDAGKQAFDALHKRCGEKIIDCDILAAPHHSGRLSRSGETPDGYSSLYEWLYCHIVRPRHLIVSAGTDNNYGHPIAHHLQEAVGHGANIICTQITPQCHRDVRRFKPTLPAVDQLPAACMMGDGVGCGGSVVVRVTGEKINIDRLEEHRQQVDGLLPDHTPICRSLTSLPDTPQS